MGALLSTTTLEKRSEVWYSIKVIIIHTYKDKSGERQTSQNKRRLRGLTLHWHSDIFHFNSKEAMIKFKRIGCEKSKAHNKMMGKQT